MAIHLVDDWDILQDGGMSENFDWLVLVDSYSGHNG